MTRQWEVIGNIAEDKPKDQAERAWEEVGSQKEQAKSPSDPSYSWIDRATINAVRWPERVGEMLAGGLQGAANIGATILSPIDKIRDALFNEKKLSDLVTGREQQSANDARRQQIREFFKDKTDPTSLDFQAGQLGAEVAGTAGIGGALARGAQAIPAVAKYAPGVVKALETGGMTRAVPASGGASTAADLAIRAGAGAAVGGASAGLVDPSNAETGAMIGGAGSVASKVGGAAWNHMREGVTEGVSALAKRAEDLGIKLPVDRILKSRALNAGAASLEYVPLSGRGGSQARLMSQANKALSRTFGQDSENVMAALGRAHDDLGRQFGDFLQSNTVKVDDAFLTSLGEHADRAVLELDAPASGIILKQINQLLEKATGSDPVSHKILGNNSRLLQHITGQINAIRSTGLERQIDGQAAYSIKKTLDRLGNRKTNEAYYALDLKGELMSALDRSIGPEAAASFKQLRRQYANMLTLEKYVRRGGEGSVSMAKLANAPRSAINTPDLQELADIAAEFLVSRESSHGAMQRVFLTAAKGTALGAGGAASLSNPSLLPFFGTMIAGGRVANTALDSDILRRAAMGQATGLQSLIHPATRAAIYQAGGQ